MEVRRQERKSLEGIVGVREAVSSLDIKFLLLAPLLAISAVLECWPAGPALTPS